MRRDSTDQARAPQRLQGGGSRGVDNSSRCWTEVHARLKPDPRWLAEQLDELVEHAGGGAPDAVAVIRKGRD